MRFSLFVRHVLSKICQYGQKHTLSSILHVFAPLNDVRAYIAWFWRKKKKNLITWFFFYEDDTSNFKYKFPPGSRRQKNT